MRNLAQYLLLLVAAVLFAPADVEAQPRRTAGTPNPVNTLVATDSIFGLVLRLEINGDIATPRDMKIVRLPVSLADFSQDNSKIFLRAFNRNNELVGRTSVSDRKMNARDGTLVVLTRRTVSVVIPLLSKPAEIEVTMPGFAPQTKISVRATINDFCSDYPAEPICSDDPPQSSRFFNLLSPPSP